MGAAVKIMTKPRSRVEDRIIQLYFIVYDGVTFEARSSETRDDGIIQVRLGSLAVRWDGS